MVSVRTVLNGLAWLQLFGFLDRLRRLRRTPGLLGPCVKQASNAYLLRFPTGLGAMAANVFFGTDGNHCHPSSSKVKVSDALQENGAAPHGQTMPLGL